MVQNSKKKSYKPERSSRRLRGLSPEIKEPMYRTPPAKGASKTSTPRNPPPLTRAPKQGEKEPHPLDFAAFAETSFPTAISHPFPQLPPAAPQAAGVNLAEMSQQQNMNTTKVMDRSRPPLPFSTPGGPTVPRDHQQPQQVDTRHTGAIPKKATKEKPPFHLVPSLAKIKRDLEDFAILFGKECNHFKLALTGQAAYQDLTAMKSNLNRLDKEYKALFEATFGQMHEYPDVQKLVRLDYDKKRNTWKAIKAIYKNMRPQMAAPSQLSAPSTTVGSSIASTQAGVMTALDLIKESIKIVELRYANFLQTINYQVQMPSQKWQDYLQEVDKFGQGLWDLLTYYGPAFTTPDERALAERKITEAREKLYTQRQPILDMFTRVQQAEAHTAAAVQQAQIERQQQMLHQTFQPQLQQQQLLQTVRSYFEQPSFPAQNQVEVNPEDSVSQTGALGGHIDPQVDLSRPPPFQQLGHNALRNAPLPPKATGATGVFPGTTGTSGLSQTTINGTLKQGEVQVKRKVGPHHLSLPRITLHRWSRACQSKRC